MGKKKFVRVTKTMAILLAVCFLVSLTAAAVSAYTTVDEILMTKIQSQFIMKKTNMVTKKTKTVVMKKNTNMTTSTDEVTNTAITTDKIITAITTDEVTKMAITKALTMAKKTAFNMAAKILSGRFLIPPTKIKDTEKALSRATLLVTMKKDTHA